MTEQATQHRDYRAPTAADSDDIDEAVAVIVQAMWAVPNPQLDLLPEAVEILTKAVAVEGGMQGMIHFVRHDMWFSLLIGGVNDISCDDHRRQARYKKALDQLVQCRLVEWRCDQDTRRNLRRVSRC